MDEISILKARIAALEAQIAPKPKPKKREKLPEAGTKDPFGIRRDGSGRPIPREVDLTPSRSARELELKAKFDELTRGCFEFGSWEYENELDRYMEADGNYRPSLWRDPMGVIRNRDGERACVAADQKERAHQIMVEMAEEAHRLKG